MTDEELLEKAKRDYPAGTVFKPVHVSEGQCKITEECTYRITGNYIYSLLPDGQAWEGDIPFEYGNTVYDRVLYDKNNNKWAEIVSKPEQQSLVGRYLKALVDKPDGGIIKAGEIGVVISITSDNRPCIVDFPSHDSYHIAKLSYENGKVYELMPKDFNPDVTPTVTKENLVGRYVKALVSNPEAIEMRIGQYCLITKQRECNADVTRLKDNGEGFGITLLNIGEIWELMPEGFVPEKKEEYKVGDFVITYGYSLNYDGRVLQITEITPNNCCYFNVFDGGYHKKYNNFSKNSIQRRATQEEIDSVIKGNTPKSKYQIGDVVDTNHKGYQYTSMDRFSQEPHTTKDVIINCNIRTREEKSCRILGKVYSPYTGGWWYETDKYGNWISEEGIEGYSVPSHPDKTSIPEFKVGQWVTLTKSNKNWIKPMDEYVGGTVQITEILDSKIGRVDFNGAEHCWVYRDGHFRLATPSEIENVLAWEAKYGKYESKRTVRPCLYPLVSGQGYDFKLKEKKNKLDTQIKSTDIYLPEVRQKTKTIKF